MAEHAGDLERLRPLIPVIERLAERIVAVLKSGGKVLACGNGGSAAQADHFVGELVGRFRAERRPLPAVALTAATAGLTAIANDYGYAEVFARQVAALGRSGDALLALSTSGSSLNLLQALERARSLGMTTLGLAGRDGGAMVSLCEVCVTIPSASTARIQELHLFIIHVVCEWVDQAFAGAGSGPATGDA